MSKAKVLPQSAFWSRGVLKQEEHQNVKVTGKTKYKTCMPTCPQWRSGPDARNLFRCHWCLRNNVIKNLCKWSLKILLVWLSLFQWFVNSNERIASPASGLSRFIAMFSAPLSSEFLPIVLKARVDIEHIGNQKLQWVHHCHFHPNSMRLSKKIRSPTFPICFLVGEAAIFIATPSNCVRGLTEQ